MTSEQRNIIKALCVLRGSSVQSALDTAEIMRVEEQGTYKDGSTIRRSIYLRKLDDMDVKEVSEFIEWLLRERK